MHWFFTCAAITLGFEQSAYRFREDDGERDDILIMKEDGRVTEQELTVQLVISAASTATRGEDFDLNQDGETLSFTFPAAAQQLAIPLEIIDDLLPETAEEFQLFLQSPQGAPAFSISINAVATVIIMDNDGKLIIDFVGTDMKNGVRRRLSLVG